MHKDIITNELEIDEATLQSDIAAAVDAYEESHKAAPLVVVSLPRFPLGQLFQTPGAMEALAEAGQSFSEFLTRHARLEQGELCDDDQRENELSAREGFRIFSAFKTAKGVKVWVITEADRSCTTILLPSEY
jgi:hypothetical protein